MKEFICYIYLRQHTFGEYQGDGCKAGNDTLQFLFFFLSVMEETETEKKLCGRK